jgi:peptide/nickel transport system ATP-binding protein
MYLGIVAEQGPVDAIYDSAAHPYTQALLDSRPSMDPATRRTVPPLTGDPPNPVNPPSGCRFRTRCASAQPRCAAEVPEWRELRPAHWVACHFSTRDGPPTRPTQQHVV